MMPTPDSLVRSAAPLADTLLHRGGADSLAVDSLATAPLRDTLPSYASLDGVLEERMHDLLEPIDTLQVPFNPHLTLQEAYGPLSELVVADRGVIPFRELLTDHPLYQGIVLLLAVAYALLICAHLNEVIGLVGKRSEGRPAAPRATYTVVVIGLLLISTLVVRLVEEGGSLYYETLPILVSTFVAGLVTILFQSVILYLIGRITIQRELMRNLMQAKTLIFVLGTVACMPPALMLLFTPPGMGLGWFWLLALMAILLFFFFLKESFQLFIAKKISILHWFLYLCAVECFPISLMVLLAIRW